MISINPAVIFIANLDHHKNEILDSKQMKYIKEKVSSDKNKKTLTVEQVYSL